MYDSSDIEFIWFYIKSLIYNAMLIYVPKKLVKRRQGPKWFNSDIRHHLKCLRSLKRKFTTHPTKNRESKIHEMENLLQLKLSQAKSNYETKQINSQSSNPAAIYSYIRSISHENALPLPVLSGVPQGSILGPLLFLIFVNDLPDTVQFSKILLFADDAKCIMPISSPLDSTHLQSYLLRLSEWCMTWNLYLNENKCSIVHYKSRPSTTSNYHINYQQIISNDKEKDLGLVVSADLNWHSHYQLISSKAYKVLGLLRRVFSNSILVPAKLSLYISLVRSQLLY